MYSMLDQWGLLDGNATLLSLASPDPSLPMSMLDLLGKGVIDWSKHR